jgi:hypothetical protein
MAMGLLVFSGLFALNSLFSVQFESKDLIPMWAAICGWIQEHKRAVAPVVIRNRATIGHSSNFSRAAAPGKG